MQNSSAWCLLNTGRSPWFKLRFATYMQRITHVSGLRQNPKCSHENICVRRQQILVLSRSALIKNTGWKDNESNNSKTYRCIHIGTGCVETPESDLTHMHSPSEKGEHKRVRPAIRNECNHVGRTDKDMLHANSATRGERFVATELHLATMLCRNFVPMRVCHTNVSVQGSQGGKTWRGSVPIRPS